MNNYNLILALDFSLKIYFKNILDTKDHCAFGLNPVATATANAAFSIRHRNSLAKCSHRNLRDCYRGGEAGQVGTKRRRREQPSQTSLLSSFEVKTRNASACKMEFIV